MKTAIRNLLGVVRRFKLATLLNVMGLSIAFAAFIILMIQLQYDWGFDRYQKNADRIFRVGIYFPDWGNQVIVSPPFAEAFIQSSPHIEKGALLNSWGSQLALKTGDGDHEISFWSKRLRFVCFLSLSPYSSLKGWPTPGWRIW